MAEFPTRHRLFRKMLAYAFVIGLLPLVIAFGFSYAFQKDTIQATMGSAFSVLARETSEKLGLLIDALLDQATQLARSERLIAASLAADRRYNGLSAQQRLRMIEQAAARWPSAAAALMDPHALKILDDLRERNPLDYHFLLLTDAEGAVIAASPSSLAMRYAHRSDPEWQAAYQDGAGSLYLGDIAWNAEIDAFTLNVAVPVRAAKQVVGMLILVHRVDRLFKSVTDVRIGRTDHTMLANSGGELLFCPVFQIRNHTLAPPLVAQLFEGAGGWRLTQADVHYPNREAINGFARVSLRTPGLSPQSLDGRQWVIFTSQNPDETYMPLQSLLGWTVFSGLIGLAFLAVSAIVTVRKIVRPITLLQQRARAISQGIQALPMGQDAPPFELPSMTIRTGDEIEDLAGLFAVMARTLKSTREQLAATSKRLEAMAITDDLTGLYNRRHVWEELRAEFSRTTRFNLQLSVIVFDLDFFKQVNDKYGHASGDDALRQFANLLRRNFREPDLLARTGGEEFLAVLPQTDSRGAQAKAEWLRKQVEDYEFAIGQAQVIRLTVSLGVATFPHAGVGDVSDLLKIGDDALYRAKHTGRNRVAVG